MHAWSSSGLTMMRERVCCGEERGEKEKLRGDVEFASAGKFSVLFSKTAYCSTALLIMKLQTNPAPMIRKHKRV